MTEHKDHIKDLFKEGLEHYEVTPPPHIWQGILQQKKHRKIVMWRWSAVAAIALLLLSLGTLFIVDQSEYDIYAEKPEKEATESKNIDKVEPSNPLESIHPGKEEILAELNKKVAEKPKTKTPTTFEKPDEKQFTEISPIESPSIELSAILAKEPSGTETTEASGDTETAVSNAQLLSKYLAELEELSDIHRNLMEARKTDNKWNLAMGYGTNPNFSMPAEENTIAPDRATFEVDDFTGDMAQETAYFAQIESTKHRHPLSFGLLTGLPLSKRLQFESGLVYTRLSTISLTYVMNGWQNEYESNLHYVGIPLGLRYEFLQRRLYNLFFSQSAILEKGIRASNTTTNFQDGVLTSSETTFGEVKGFQLSTLSSIGADIAITKQFSLYAQAGVQFFFLNEKQPYNIRSTRTAWPSMQTGLRYRFK